MEQMKRKEKGHLTVTLMYPHKHVHAVRYQFALMHLASAIIKSKKLNFTFKATEWIGKSYYWKYDLILNSAVLKACRKQVVPTCYL